MQILYTLKLCVRFLIYKQIFFDVNEPGSRPQGRMLFPCNREGKAFFKTDVVKERRKKGQ